MKDLNQVFSNNVRAQRIKKGLSQEELGELSDLHRTYIGGIERCERNVTLKNVEKIANALGVKAVFLLDEKNDKNPNKC